MCCQLSVHTDIHTKVEFTLQHIPCNILETPCLLSLHHLNICVLPVTSSYSYSHKGRIRMTTYTASHCMHIRLLLLHHLNICVLPVTSSNIYSHKGRIHMTTYTTSHFMHLRLLLLHLQRDLRPDRVPAQPGCPDWVPPNQVAHIMQKAQVDTII